MGPVGTPSASSNAALAQGSEGDSTAEIKKVVTFADEGRDNLSATELSSDDIDFMQVFFYF